MAVGEATVVGEATEVEAMAAVEATVVACILTVVAVECLFKVAVTTAVEHILIVTRFKEIETHSITGAIRGSLIRGISNVAIITR
jgi:hypothetical protein